MYATLLATDSYLPGLQLLTATLRQFTQRTLVILITPNITKTTKLFLKKLPNVMIHKVPNIGKPDVSEGSWEASQYTKLHIFNLIQFSQVFYIDADAIVMSDPEPIF